MRRPTFSSAAGLLTGAALVAACSNPHASATVERRDCENCHASEYDTATVHAERGYSRTCWWCHGQSGWRPAAVHHAQFKIHQDPHLALDCADCHLDEIDHEQVTCTSCHEHTEGRTSPLHVGNGDYDYAPRSCLSCHRKRERQRTCADCHLSEITGRTLVPAHGPSMQRDCDNCHQSIAWRPAAIDHDAFWPLTGAHASASCAGCHDGEVFAGTPRECVGCHDGLQARSRVDHTQLTNPSACERCHDTTAWVPAEFPDHGAFYSLRGDHRGLECGDCHTDVTSYAVFTCIDCHEHSQSRTDGEHRGVNGYAYESQACLDCHRNGVDD